MRLKHRSARTWTYIVGSIKEVLDEGVFIVTKDGLSLRALDTSRVAMVDLFYPSEAFDEFPKDLKGEESFGVSFDAFSKALARSLHDESMTLETQGSALLVSFEGHGVRLFKIPLISLSVERPPEPKISFTVTASIMPSSFMEAVKAVEEVAESLTLQASDDKIYFIGAGDVEKVEVELSKDKENLLDIKVDSPDRATYSVEYFDIMLKASRGAEQVLLQYAQDAPVKVQFSYGDAGRLTFYVSPRVE